MMIVFIYIYSLNKYDLKENLFPGEKRNLTTCIPKILDTKPNLRISSLKPECQQPFKKEKQYTLMKCSMKLLLIIRLGQLSYPFSVVNFAHKYTICYLIILSKIYFKSLPITLINTLMRAMQKQASMENVQQKPVLPYLLFFYSLIKLLIIFSFIHYFH